MQSELIGRFAPSPTGDLHFGSLLAALASYCDAKHHHGRWHVRIDDIDEPRSVAGSASAILKSLDIYGFEWDGDVLWQSHHLPRYADALSELVKHQFIFTCNCSRRKLPSGMAYPGNCRDQVVPYAGKDACYRKHDHALRCRMRGQVSFTDAVQGSQTVNLETDPGDIIVWRRDQLVSYALACAIDDSDKATHVVRGADLLSSTSAQIGIMQALHIPVPQYAHIPVALDANGDKLSKHSKAPAIITQEPLPTLLQAWNFLEQIPMTPGSVEEFWQHAVPAWSMDRVPAQTRMAL